MNCLQEGTLDGNEKTNANQMSKSENRGRVMWIAAEHSDQDNLRWSWLRAIEWSGWPLFISQPIIPVLLYFYDWRWILLGVFLATLLWRMTVLQWSVSVRIVDIGPLFVLLKFLTCPLMAVLIWRQGHHIIAGLALLWPLVGLMLINWALAIIHGFLGAFVLRLSPERTIHVGPIQNRFMDDLGYARMEDPIQDCLETGWQYRGQTIHIQTHARLEFAHPLFRELFAPLLSPDWDCFVDRKLVGLYFGSAAVARNNGKAFVLKQAMAQEGNPMRLPEEEQVVRPKLVSYKLKGRTVDIFLTKKSTLFEPQGWTCLVDRQLVGFGFRSREKAKSNAFLCTENRLGSDSPSSF
jgi:hypothetical protein